MFQKRAVFFTACCGTIAIAAVANASTMAQMNAPPVPWTDAGATTFVERDAAHRLTAIGLVIPASTVKALPKGRSEAVYPLADAGLVQTVNLQWHPYGHEPEHIYDVPHFDVHFFTIDEKTRGGIVPGAPAGKIRPPKSALPPAVIVAPGFVPGMGMHVIPASQPEFKGSPFTVSPIIGYWKGNLAFFEVMVTKAWLEKNADAQAAYPQPVTAPVHGWYPTRYAVHYDKEKDAYRIAITDFRQR